jgi:RNA recognition motif-containing protein
MARASQEVGDAGLCSSVPSSEVAAGAPLGRACGAYGSDGSMPQKEQSMSTNIYVGNLSFQTDSDALKAIFSEYGEVISAQVIADRDTGRSRGFGFVEMASGEEAEKAIAETNGKNVDGRQLNVNIARERSR